MMVEDRRIEILKSFFGREPELKFLFESLKDGQQKIALSGAPGIGKSTLANVLAHRAKAEIDKSVSMFSIFDIGSPDEIIQEIFLKSNGFPKIAIIDDIDTIRPEYHGRLEAAIEEFQYTQFVLVGRSGTPVLESMNKVVLHGFSFEESKQFIELRNHLAHTPITNVELNDVLKVTSGNPTLLTSLINELEISSIKNWSSLSELLKPFKTYGILGPNGQPLKLESDGYQKIIFDSATTNERVLELLKSEPELAWKLPSRRFEEIVAELLQKQGYEVELSPASGDGGFDIYAARRDGLGQFLFLVECKRYTPPNKVGVGIVRSLHGVVQSQQATAGAIVSTSYFTKGAKELQSRLKHQMQLNDYLILQKWIKDFPIKRS